MEIHMLRKHLFPAPLQSTVNVASDLPTPPVTARFLPPKTETVPELRTPETEQTCLEADDKCRLTAIDVNLCDPEENMAFNSNCIENMNFNLHTRQLPIPEALRRVRMSNRYHLSSLTSRSHLCCFHSCALTSPPSKF